MPTRIDEPEGGLAMLRNLLLALPWRYWRHPLPCDRLDHPREQLVVTYPPCRRVDARRGVAVGCNFCHAV
jgi:hypothetical protein